MSRIRSYLIRATYDWIVEHDLTPYILLDAELENVEVPYEYVDDGKILLNVSPKAIIDLQLEDDFVGFKASFSGEQWQVFAPIAAVLALYANETSQGVYARDSNVGMLVNEDDHDGNLDPRPDKGDSGAKDSPKDNPGLRIVK